MADKLIQLNDGASNNLYPTIAVGQTQVVTDYVIEQGTSGIWTYRKWASGIAECWLTAGYTNSSALSLTSTGALYVSQSMTLNYPTGLFATFPNVTADAQRASTWIVVTAATKANYLDYQVVRTVGTDTSAVAFSVQCKGRWK